MTAPSIVNTQAIIDLVGAVDRLNSYMRAPSSRRHEGLHHHVYWLKGRALDAANKVGCVIPLPIYAVVNCRKCGGSGDHVYYHSYSGQVRDIEPCWGCGGYGKIKLYFLESKICATLQWQSWTLPEIIWHTPISERQAGPDAEPAGDWKPRTPGRELTIDDLCAALVTAERSADLIGRRNYGLNLGRVEGPCSYCRGAIGDGDYCHVTRGRLSWSAPACKSCRDHYDMLSRSYGGNLTFDRMPFPESLASPAIHEWAQMQGGLDALLKARSPSHAEW